MVKGSKRQVEDGVMLEAHGGVVGGVQLGTGNRDGSGPNIFLVGGGVHTHTNSGFWGGTVIPETFVFLQVCERALKAF